MRWWETFLGTIVGEEVLVGWGEFGGAYCTLVRDLRIEVIARQGTFWEQWLLICFCSRFNGEVDPP